MSLFMFFNIFLQKKMFCMKIKNTSAKLKWKLMRDKNSETQETQKFSSMKVIEFKECLI